jgi:hypothetical protein
MSGPYIINDDQDLCLVVNSKKNEPLRISDHKSNREWILIPIYDPVKDRYGHTRQNWIPQKR